MIVRPSSSKQHVKVWKHLCLGLFIATNILAITSGIVHAQGIDLHRVHFDGANLVVEFTYYSNGTYEFEFCLNGGNCTYPTVYFTDPRWRAHPFGGYNPLQPNTTYSVKARLQGSGAWSNTVSCTTNNPVTSCGDIPAPPPDSDGDGVLDSTDLCPADRGPSPHGCPDPDGDGGHNGIDACPNQAGPASNAYCPASVPNPPPIVIQPQLQNNDPPPNNNPPLLVVEPALGFCQIGYNPDHGPALLMTEPSISSQSVMRVNSQQVFNVTGITQGDDGVDWYAVTIGAATANPQTVYARSNAVRFGGQSPSGGCAPLDAPSNNSEQPSIEQTFQALGCPLPADLSLPDYALLLIASQPDPCELRTDLVWGNVGSSAYQNVTQRLLPGAELAGCEPGLIELLDLLTQDNQGQTSLATLNRLLIPGQACTTLAHWRDSDDEDSTSIPSDVPRTEVIDIRITTCSDPNLTPDRLNELREALSGDSPWSLSDDDLRSHQACEIIRSVNRIGAPTDHQRSFLERLRSCGLSPSDALTSLEHAIASGTDHASLLDDPNLSCETLINRLSAPVCEERTCNQAPVPPELQACANSGERLQSYVQLFLKTRLPGLQVNDAETLNRIYGALDVCQAVIDYINTGNRYPAPKTLPGQPGASSEPLQSQFPDDSPIVALQLGSPAPPETNSPIITSQASTIFSLMAQTDVRGVYVRTDNDASTNLFLVENGIEIPIEVNVNGEKYAPILMHPYQTTVLAYILVPPGENPVIRIVNLDWNIFDDYSLPVDVWPDIDSRLAFIAPTLYVTGKGIDGSQAIYALDLQQGVSESPVIENGYNPAAGGGLLVFERASDPGGQLFLRHPSGITSGEPFDTGIAGRCFEPLLDGLTLEFVCEVNGSREVYTGFPYDSKVVDPNFFSDISIDHLTLGPLPGEILFDNSDDVYLYHRRAGNPSITPFIFGADRISRLHLLLSR